MRKITDLTRTSSEKDFWNDTQKAAKISQELELLKNEVTGLENIEKKVDELIELIGLFENSENEEKQEVEKQFLQLQKEFDDLEFKSLLGGEYDKSDVILAIRSGAGGVDAQDWAQMLEKMYLKWSEKNGFKAVMVEETRGAEAGIKSATIEISGPYAYGYLQSEAGVHRLVRLSPFNSDNLRQTSFAIVEVLPVIEEIAEVIINPQDLVIDTYRASGAGGQHVNTTDSAVRITHTPTNIVVTCQSERSQLQNKEQAMKVLKARIHQRYLEEQKAEKEKLRGEYKSAEWGSQIRSYVIHPYKMVKDHRTKFETSDAEKVLEGELQGFMESFLRWQASNGE
ncbi:MAG: Peptide chain release factor RF-2 [Candidatus Moranbacteria bacterium GW2011_GWC2_37_73]|nr:MAG: Peptide chain release factor RF-2 [Parcubacteria group bacterium GW2011_GWC1_36_108]KKQ00848.1 MAG: Peptide chain release factor RF-2 [Candidatus Moranbacteria bacterium GW2011_GWD1_36_198]KKQ02281.1 MAG: Peptide chain release factor RF-2 [Candidatus Moranbacteria bacterium GW2011_GWD2_36_198]KKQ39991.1 MAG: Peptide chain release factor RF-2 [Candidatus Moranbacteria bacterium GW2011_GWC2_37_73]